MSLLALLFRLVDLISAHIIGRALDAWCDEEKVA